MIVSTKRIIKAVCLYSSNLLKYLFISYLILKTNSFKVNYYSLMMPVVLRPQCWQAMLSATPCCGLLDKLCRGAVLHRLRRAYYQSRPPRIGL